MIPRTAAAIARATGGRVVAGDADVRATGVSIDSRSNLPGELFVAIAGERLDWHDFVTDAVRRGAPVVLAHREVDASGAALVLVDDTTNALGALATDERDRRRLEVVGVTGSAGKTTTRALTVAALGARFHTAATPGNFNNHWGLPLSLLRLPEDAEAAVLEMGMNHLGEIEALARIARPNVGVITNIGTAHIGNLGSKAGIAAAKAELLDGLSGDGVGIVPTGTPELAPHIARAADAGKTIVSFGFEHGADYLPENIAGDLVHGARFTLRGVPVQLALWGRHAVLNATAALAAAEALGVPLGDAAPRLAQVEQAPGRGRIVRAGGGVVVVDEVYNANPSAMNAVLEEIGRVAWTGRRVAVLGEMLEMGDHAEAVHRALGASAAAAGIVALHAVGALAGTIAEGARAAGLSDVRTYAGAAEAAAAVPALLEDGDLVLVKGSRGVRLEQVRDAVIAARGEAAAR